MQTINPAFIRAAKPKPRKAPAAENDALDLTGGDAVTIEAREAGDAAGTKVRRFNIVAYNGGPLAQMWSEYPIVVDLAGMDVGASGRPVLIDHDSDLDSILGQTDKVEVLGSKLKVAGSVYGESERCRQLIALHDKGFKFQASIGARILKREFVAEGSKATANGRTFAGPVVIARKTVLGEVSFVALGADDRATASIAAHKAGKGSVMNFEQWLEAKGITAADLSDVVRGVLKAQFEAEQKKPAPATDPVVQAKASKDDDPPADPAAQIRATAAAESIRIAAIRKACGGKHDELEAKAIAEGWDTTKTELEVLRAARPASDAGSPAVHARQKAATNDVLEAAMCLSRGVPNLEKVFKVETLEAADRYYRNLGVQELVLIAASANGYHGGPGARVHQGNIREVLEHAFPVRATFSTLSLPAVFQNVANKELLAGYMEEDQTWREISVTKPVRDFKAITSFRLLDDMEYEELAPDGKIKHGTLGEESYTRQVRTYAKMFSLSRVDLINDDAGAFDDLRERLGRGAAKKLNNVFWAKFLDNATLFTADLGNYVVGAGTPLAVDGVALQTAITAFRRLRSPTADGSKRIGNAVGGRPTILLVPPELQFIAERLYLQTNMVESVANANIHANKYKPIVVDWLSDSDFTGYSATAWYLLRPPTTAAAIVVSFLNGVQTPTVESAQVDFDQLGIQFRGYHDFGVDHAEGLAGVKVKGAA